MPDPSPSLTLTQATHALHRSERCIRRWIATGKLPAEKISGPTGAEWRIDAAAVAALGGDLPDPAGPCRTLPDILPHPTGQSEGDLSYLAAPSAEEELTAEVHLIETRLARIEGALAGAWVSELTEGLRDLATLTKSLKSEMEVSHQREEALAAKIDAWQEEAHCRDEQAGRREEQLLAELQGIKAALNRPPWWGRLWERIKGK